MAAQKESAYEMTKAQKVYFTYVTCPDLKTAEAIALKCVNSRVAACANILPEMRSVYVWQDKLESAAETVLILKTVENQLGSLEKTILESHPYKTPCIVNLPIDSGHSGFLAWIRDTSQK
jgi:periplasmic divalent cation tolerance protein